MRTPRILVIGGTSLDVREGQLGRVAGGAGMYTAMACHRSGAEVTLLAPRPDPMPPALAAVATRVTWLGPVVTEQQLPHFDIRHNADKGEYVEADYGAESLLSTDFLPEDLSGFDFVHVVPLGDHSRQLEFVHACRQRSARRVSAGTLADLIDARPRKAREVLEHVDFFFMNEEEALRFFDSLDKVQSKPGQVVFVTRGADGVSVVQGTHTTLVPGVQTDVVDPTGAGDTFCGAAITALARNCHPVVATQTAVPLAARVIAADAATALLQKGPLPTPLKDTSVTIDDKRLKSIAALVSAASDAKAFDFTGPDLPPPDHPFAVDYFFACVLQQFGFWTAQQQRYGQPLIAKVDGQVRKGAFYLFRAYRRILQQTPELLAPAAQAQLSGADFRRLLRADDDSEPLPAMELHHDLARQYGSDMLATGWTPSTLLEHAQRSTTPLATLLNSLDHIGGYKEDPLRKKSSLLTMILMQRPEQFLVAEGDVLPPIVDYHVMRSCLRTGLVVVNDAALLRKLAARELLTADEEWAVRATTFNAVNRLVDVSGKSMGDVDWFFFQARERCPEMTAPDCAACSIDLACAHKKSLFQPVRRTSYY